MLRLGDYATINVQGHASAVTPDSLAGAVTEYLQPFGFDVAKNTVAPATDILSNLLSGNVLEWDYLAKVTVKINTAGYSDPSAVVNVVQQAFADLTGHAPTGAFLDGAQTKGAPTADTPESGLLHTLGLDSAARGLSGVVESATREVNFVLLLVVGLVVLVLVLAAYGPNVTKLATVRL